MRNKSWKFKRLKSYNFLIDEIRQMIRFKLYNKANQKGMHNYSVQNRYKTKTKLGNWYEESEKADYEFKQFLYQKDQGNNTALNTTSKLAFSSQPISLTVSKDNYLNSGDVVMLQNLFTEGVLSFNLYEQVISDKDEQSYAVTTTGLNHAKDKTKSEQQPQLRNCWKVEVVGDESTGERTVNYGDKLRFVSLVNGQNYYLQSIPISPMRSSKFSRLQQVSLTSKLSSSAIWIIQHPNPKLRIDSLNQPVSLEEELLIKHNNTAQHLASDKVNYVNQFGQEYETFAKSMLTNNKTQNLFAEKIGHKSVEEPLRTQGLQNYWRFITARN